MSYSWLIPLICLFGASILWSFRNNKNQIAGYRTPRSMVNANTWKFSNKLGGAIYLSIAVMLLFSRYFTENLRLVDLFGLVMMVMSIFSIEGLLRLKYDKKGKARDVSSERYKWVFFIVVPVLFSLVIYLLIISPQQVPIHMTISGEIDGYGSKWLLLIMVLPAYLLTYPILKKAFSAKAGISKGEFLKSMLAISITHFLALYFLIRSIY